MKVIFYKVSYNLNGLKQVILIVLSVVLSTHSLAQTPEEYHWKRKQIGCKIASQEVAKDAVIFGEFVLQIQKMAKITTPESRERKEVVKLYSETKDKFIEKWRNKFKEYRQGTDVNNALLAGDFELSVYAAVEIASKNPGKTFDWYQDQIFEECTRSYSK